MRRVFLVGTSRDDLGECPQPIRQAVGYALYLVENAGRGRIMKHKSKCTESSGNVFADLGISNPEEALAKAEIVRQIHRTIKKKRLTQTKAAKILGISQPKVSRLLRGYFENFSLERLFRFLNKLGQDIRISITEEPRRRTGHTSIVIGECLSNIAVAAMGKETLMV